MTAEVSRSNRDYQPNPDQQTRADQEEVALRTQRRLLIETYGKWGGDFTLILIISFSSPSAPARLISRKPC